MRERGRKQEAIKATGDRDAVIRECRWNDPARVMLMQC